MQLDKGSFSFSQTNQAVLAQSVCNSYKNEELLMNIFPTIQMTICYFIYTNI